DNLRFAYNESVVHWGVPEAISGGGKEDGRDRTGGLQAGKGRTPRNPHGAAGGTGPRDVDRRTGAKARTAVSGLREVLGRERHHPGRFQRCRMARRAGIRRSEWRMNTSPTPTR